jgi:ligand-binding sensor domain-containing protein
MATQANAQAIKPLVRWSFWVSAERMDEFAPAFDDEIVPVLAAHGFLNGQPDTRVVPDSIFSRVYEVPSRAIYEQRRDSLQAAPEWRALMQKLGERFERTDENGDLQRMVAPYRDPAGKPTPTYAPPGRVVPVGPGRGHWTTYGVPDGLPSLDLPFLLEDRDGHIWICTWGSGLSRWDGEGITTFAPEDGIAGLDPRHLMQTRDGDLWITFASGGLSRFDGERFETYDLRSLLGLEGDVRTEITYEDSKGRVWIAAHKQGLIMFDGERFHRYTAQDGLASDRVMWWKSILEDRLGRLWVGTDGGISRWDGRGKVHFETIGPAVSAWHFLEDQRGTVWVTARPHVVRFDGDDWELLTREGGPILYDESSGMQDMIVDRQGTLWILTDSHGMYSWDGEMWKHTGPDDGFNNDWHILRMFEDEEGIFWFTGRDGLRRWDGQQMTHYTTKDGLDNNNIRSALVDRRGDLWLGTAGNLSRFDPRRFVTFTEDQGISFDVGVHAMRDSNSHLWFVSEEGITRYDGETFSTWMREDGLNVFEGSQAYEDVDGAIWVTGWGVLYRLHQDSLTTYTDDHGLSEQFTLTTHRDSAGALWIGGRGLTRFAGSTFDHFTIQDGLVDFYVGQIIDRDGVLWLNQVKRETVYENGRFSVPEAYEHLGGHPIRWQHLDHEARLWFGSHSHGVFRWDGRQMTHFTTADGLGHNAIRKIAQTADGHVWFGTDGGVVSRFDGKVFQTLSRDDGLNGQAIRDIDQAASGDIWFTTFGGITRYRPPPPLAPEVFVDAVVAGQRHVNPRDLRIPSSADLMQVEFHGRSLTTPATNLVYLYRLRGHDTDWRQTRSRRIEYEDLEVGDYTFEIQAVDRDLVYSDTLSVELEVFFQPTLASVGIDSVHLEELFASSYRDYETRAFGAVWVANHDADTMQVDLTFQLLDWMRRPSRQQLRLAPGETRRADLTAKLEEEILSLTESDTSPARVDLSFAAAGDSVVVRRSIDVVVHEQGAVRWTDGVAPAAAFITPTDPGIAAFASEGLRHFANEVDALGRPGNHLSKAMVLFEALHQHGIRYLEDASQPYATRREGGVIDHIQYPAQTLRSRTGDCDDLTVLYASLLESAGVSTALVDFPEHVFLLVDTGLSRWEAYRLPLDDRLTVVYGDRVWIPVEITRIDNSFYEAWGAGAEEMAKLSTVKQRQRITLTADAWARYTPAAPTQVATPSPEPSTYAAAIATGHRSLQQMIDVQMDERYLLPLRDNPSDDELRTRLLKVYVSLAAYDKAIEAALAFLIDERGDGAATHNHLGIAYFMKGEALQATLHFKQAVAARPDDEGLQLNLDHALWTLGRSDRPAGSGVAAVASVSESRGDAAGVSGDDFYWVKVAAEQTLEEAQ